jgi:hypothetical protein
LRTELALVRATLPNASLMVAALTGEPVGRLALALLNVTAPVERWGP